MASPARRTVSNQYLNRGERKKNISIILRKVLRSPVQCCDVRLIGTCVSSHVFAVYKGFVVTAIS